MAGALCALFATLACERRREVSLKLPDPSDTTPVALPVDTTTQNPFTDSTRFLAVDSSGVAIVQSLDSLWRDDGWYVDTSDVILSIGVALGDTTYELHGVAHAARLASGGIALSESSEAGTWIKVFDATGRYRYRVGRAGQGPGEFRTITEIIPLPGGSIAVYDNMASRLNVFAPSGRVARTSEIPVLSSVRFANVRPIENGMLIGALAVGAINAGISPAGEPVISRDSLILFNLDTISRGGSRVATIQDREVIQAGPISIYQPYSGNAVWAVAGNSIFAGNSGRAEITEYDSSGVVRRVIRAPVLDVALEQDSIQALRQTWENQIAAGGGQAPFARVRRDHSRFPEFRPRYDNMISDSEGNLWLRVPQSTDRIVIDRHGRVLGTVHIPPGRKIQQIGSDWILFQRMDRLGVEYVEVLRLVKDSTSAR